MALEPDPVLDDPFFGVVRRRHPDVDIVLLPPERAALDGADPGDAPVLGAEEFAETAERDLAELESRARDCVGKHRLVQESDEGWVATSDGLINRRRLFAVTGVDAGEGAGLINAAAAVLGDDGWQVDRPSAGQARLLARRGPLSLHVVHVPSAQRVALITQAGPYPVETAVAKRLAADQRGASGDDGRSGQGTSQGEGGL